MVSVVKVRVAMHDRWVHQPVNNFCDRVVEAERHLLNSDTYVVVGVVTVGDCV